MKDSCETLTSSWAAASRTSCAKTTSSPLALPEPSDRPTILIIDDEPGVLALLEAALPEFGFRTIIAANGPDGIAKYHQHRGEIDLVLLDVTMPGMDGPQTFRALQRLNPGVRCCFMSGFTGNYATDELTALGARHLFSKPFRLDALAKSLQGLIPPRLAA